MRALTLRLVGSIKVSLVAWSVVLLCPRQKVHCPVIRSYHEIMKDTRGKQFPAQVPAKPGTCTAGRTPPR
jgi:hypothetical protein